MNIVVAGSRTFNDYKYMKLTLDKYFLDMMEYVDKEEITIISANCEGADMLAERYAKEHNYRYIWIPIRWEIYGEDAWKYSNEEMATMGNILIAYWDGFSGGTEHMIELAKNYKLDVVIDYIGGVH